MTEKDLENCRLIIDYMIKVYGYKNVVAERLGVNVSTINWFGNKQTRYTTILKIYKWYKETINKVLDYPRIVF